VFIGAAWPYANQSLHLGHVSALLGSDILARYFRAKGDSVLFVSGSDCHGTPITVSAEKQKVKPEVIAQKYHQEFLKNLVDGLKFSYDNYTTTLTENHKKIVQEIFLKLYEKGDIYTKTQELPYCPTCKRFLPDRYIEGECPKCHFKEARGDQCDNCGAILDPKDLINPHCKTCSSQPEFRESEHFFLRLSRYQKKLESWVSKSKFWRPNALGFTKKLLKEGLHDRAITRDIDWGVPIPLPGYDEKRIYVWFEAVCGYFSASREWANKEGQPDIWREFWQNKNAIHYYVHGKDNIPFHTIVWPAILMGYGGLNLPDRIIPSEYLTLKGKQFSKSRGWAVTLPHFLQNFDAETLRYYLTISGPETSDADFTWKNYQERVNKELIGNFANFIHRTFHLISENFPNGVRRTNVRGNGQNLLEQTIKSYETAGRLIEEGKFRDALKNIFALTEAGNQFLAETEPWKKIKQDKAQAESDLAVCAEVILNLGQLVSPFLPQTAQKIINPSDTIKWEYKTEKIYKFSRPEIIFKRIEDKQIEIEEEILTSAMH